MEYHIKNCKFCDTKMTIKLPESFYVDDEKSWFGFVPLRNRFGRENSNMPYATRVYQWCLKHGHKQGPDKKLIGWYYGSSEIYRQEVELQHLGCGFIRQLLLKMDSYQNEIRMRSEELILAQCEFMIENDLQKIIKCFSG